jgi:phosphate starvation-inducible PhoH-like protein
MFLTQPSRWFYKIPAITKSLLSMRVKKSDASESILNSCSSSASSASFKKLSPNYNPKTENQKKYVDILNNPCVSIIFGVGPAGCGKTLFACLHAIQELKKGNIQKIILTRPIVPVEEEEIGFLPGNLVNKMNPWTRPIFDIFLEFYAQKDLDSMIQSGVIEIAPLAFMRGRTFKRSIIIADEMQNSTPNQMLMLTTRIGDGSKMIITGDLKQSDRSADNGLYDIILKLQKWGELYEEIKLVELTDDDIRRSYIVSRVIELYGRPIGWMQ